MTLMTNDTHDPLYKTVVIIVFISNYFGNFLQN